MTCDTVWSVTWHFSGQHDLRCHKNFFITQPPDNTDTSLLDILEGHFGHVNLDTSVSTTSTEKSQKGNNFKRRKLLMSQGKFQ